MADESVEDVEKFVMEDRCVSVRRVACKISISVGSVQAILHDRPNFFKASTRLVPRLLTLKQNIMRKHISQEILRLYEADPKDFFDPFVSQDETWIPHFGPECKSESCQWKHPGSPAPKKVSNLTISGENRGHHLLGCLGNSNSGLP